MPSATRLLIIAGAIVAIVAGGLRFHGSVLGSGDPGDSTFATAQVRRLTLRETITLRGEARFAVRATAHLDVDGRVTATPVRTGEVIFAGDVVLEVNGRPIVAAPGEFPFWRRLAAGAEGKDVAQLERFLADTGLDPGEIDEAFTNDTTDALAAWQQKLGVTDDGILETGDLLVGAWPARLGTFSLSVGDFVAPRTTLGTLTEPEISVSVELTPTQRLRVNEGLSAIVEVTGTRDQFRGTLASIAEVTTAVPGAVDLPGGQSPKAEGFEGLIQGEVPTELVDGTSLSVQIVLREVTDVIAVPVAAVGLNGEGQSVVQVVDENGDRRNVLVETGLAEGAFVEVTSGLDGSETVVIGTLE